MQYPHSIPLFERLQIESQSHCNRACWFCPRTYDRSGNYLDASAKPIIDKMPTEKILDVLDQAAAMGFQGLVGFHHYSEPLLDNRNLMLAREALARGLKPYIHTNGDVLVNNSELCREVSRHYTFIVLGLYDYETDEELAEAKRRWQERLPDVDLRFSSIGINGAKKAHSIGVPKALVPTDSRMALPDLTFANGPCGRPLIRLIIQYNGKMCNCCEDDSGTFELGSIYENSLEELWYSERHIQIVEDLLAGRREKYKLCSNCPMSPTGPHPDGQRIRISRRVYSGS